MPNDAPLGDTRQRTIDALCEHFANDVLQVEEFEQRVEAAHKADTAAELEALLNDLPGAPLPAKAEAAGPALQQEFRVTSAAHVKEHGFVVAVMGGAARKGRWHPARKNWNVALMGGMELDFREAVLGPGVTEVSIFALMGGVEIIAPPGLNVESHGIGILGGFEHAEEIEHDPDPHAPTLRITGFACMGGVEVTFRHPGESSRNARRRRRLERKEKRRLRSGD